MKPFAFAALALLAAPFALVAARPAAVAPPAAVPKTWEIDPVHSSVVFKIRHMNVASFYGRFNQVTGTVVLDEQKPAEAKVELVIPVASVDTNNAKRDDHLKSPDFFNAKEFAEIKFVSKSAKKVDKLWKIDGELTLHGVTKPLSIDVEPVGEIRDKGVMGFDTTFKLKRSDHGMSFMLEGLGDEITVMAGIECKAK